MFFLPIATYKMRILPKFSHLHNLGVILFIKTGPKLLSLPTIFYELLGSPSRAICDFPSTNIARGMFGHFSVSSSCQPVEGIKWFYFCARRLHERCVNSLAALVCFHVFPQIACLREGRAALVAFVWLFSTVRFQMCPQISCMRGYIVTLIAFVWFFSTVRF